MKVKLTDKIKKTTKPFLIAGPCSAESEQQVVSVAKDIANKTNATVLRSGIWKPRTRPDSFEGVGAIGLPWLVNAGKEAGLLTTTEVANAKHVEQTLKAGVDILWVGARTTVNPFAVQEIADALKGVEIPVMVKNPINPDLMLWIGALERFKNAGITDLTAIHRGFSVYNHPKYRNVPNWEIPIGLREKMPDIQLICDPSHISGRRAGLRAVSQKAMDLNFEGLMIETHPNPDEAWSDAKQQITPDGLVELIDSLVLRQEELTADALSIMEVMRDKIGGLDDKIFELLTARMKLSEEVGDYKRKNEITILQQDHWKRVIAQRMQKSEEYDLTAKFIRDIMDAIHQESIRKQTRVMNPGM